MKFDQVMKKKILIVSRAFYPINSPRSFRTTELVKELAKQGHDVTVYIQKNDNEHTIFENEHSVKINDLGKSKLPKINVHTGNKYYKLFKRAINRTLLQLFQYPDIELMFQVKKVLREENDYDLLISIAVPFPIHWGVAWSINKNHQVAKTWVADCGDPYYFNSHDSFNKLFYFQYVEKWFSRKADYISIPFEGLKKYFFREFDNKYKVIPQGFNFDEIDISNEPVNNKIITFAYAGGFIRDARDPRIFLDYLTTLNQPFQFIIYNKQKEFTDPYKSKLGNKLIVKNYIPRKDLLIELSRMDFLINLEYDPTNQAPSKLIDYSLTKRPILMIKNKEFNKNIILDFLNKDYSNQFTYPDIEVYNIKNVVWQFLDLIK